MAILQGNTYLLPVQVLDCDGAVIHVDQVVKGEFTFGNITKIYGDGGDVTWNEELQSFIVPLTESETFGLNGTVKYQGRVLLKDGSVSGSVPASEYIYDSIGKTILSGSNEVGEQSGKILEVKLLDRVVNTGITEETDPTVPSYVKEITEQDISDWNKVKTLGDVYRAKGSVQTYADLPTENNQVGDVYNVIEAYGDYGAGTNFVWTTENTWDALGSAGGVSAEEFNKLVNNEIQIKSSGNGFKAGGNASAYSGNIAIGNDARAYGKSNTAVAIGNSARVSAEKDRGVAIGYQATAGQTHCVQLGDGTNETPYSLQIFKDNVYNHNTHTLTVQNIELNGENLAEKLESAGGANVTNVDGEITTEKFEGIVHLSEAQYQELITNGSITIGEQTLEYNENAIYVTPDNSGSGGAESGGSKKYIHNISIRQQSTLTFSFTLKIINNSNTPIDYDLLKNYLIDNNFNSITKCLQCSGSFIHTANGKYASVFGLSAASGNIYILCDFLNFLDTPITTTFSGSHNECYNLYNTATITDTVVEV